MSPIGEGSFEELGENDPKLKSFEEIMDFGQGAGVIV